MLQKIPTLIILLTCIVTANSQDLSLFSAGGSMTSSGNLYLSYSIGEPCIQETQNGSQWMTEGFQQPEPIHLMVGIHETATTLPISVFPNPTSSTITISGLSDNNTYSNHGIEIQMLNQLGQIVFTRSFGIGEELIIGIENLPAGLYLLHLRSNSTSLFTQSIVKL